MSELYKSKPLGHDDTSGFEFVKEILDGDPTAGINFDRLQRHPTKGYIIFEWLLCDEKQQVTPYSSHPKNYWDKNKAKFISLWRVACDLKATLYLVNYAKAGTKAADEILLIKVLDLDKEGIKNEEKKKYTRKEFQEWFRKLNKECLYSYENPVKVDGIKCPNCGGSVFKSESGYYCIEQCGMNLSSVYGTEIGEENIKGLLEGKECIIKTKNGYNTRIVPSVTTHFKNGKTFINWQTYNC